jgi:hypothetical protein
VEELTALQTGPGATMYGEWALHHARYTLSFVRGLNSEFDTPKGKHAETLAGNAADL